MYGRDRGYCFEPARQYNHPAISDVSGTASHPNDACAHQLLTFGGVAACLYGLKHLGLHNISMSPSAIRSLGLAAGSLPHTITTLALDFVLVHLTVTQKMMLFKAISRMRSLQKLRMPQWEEVVGGDAGACVVPLQMLPHLQAVLVSEMKESPAFPTTIVFKTIQNDT